MRSGFTLIELLIVLAIIGVLMGIGIPIYTNQLEKAKIRGVAANLKMLAQSAVNAVLIGDFDHLNPGDPEENVDISEYVKGIDASKYELKVKREDDGKYTVTAVYTGGDLDADDVGNELVGCDATKIVENGQELPVCKIEGISPAW